MLDQMIRYVRGYVRIRVSGRFAERFLNSCSHHKVRLWELKPVLEGYEMNLFLSGFRKMQPVIKKTGIRFVIIKRIGFPFWIYQYRKRHFFFPGFFLCILAVYFLSSHIWGIEFSGNQTHTDALLLKYLESENIHSGMKRSAVDCAGIAEDMRKTFPDIVWVSASLDGSRLKIQIKENDGYLESSEETEEETKGASAPMDLTADMDGVITDIIPREGVVMVTEGTEVKKGDILVSGYVPVLNDQKEIIAYQEHKADARIIAQVSLDYRDQIHLFYTHKQYDLVKKQMQFVQFGSVRFLFGSIRHSYSYWTLEGEERQIHIGSLMLPVTYGSLTIRPYHPDIRRYTTREIRQRLTERFVRYKSDLEKKGVEIIENDVKIYTESEEAVAAGRLKILTPIGVLKESEPLPVPEEEKEKDTWDLQNQ